MTGRPSAQRRQIAFLRGIFGGYGGDVGITVQGTISAVGPEERGMCDRPDLPQPKSADSAPAMGLTTGRGPRFDSPEPGQVT